MCNFKDIKLLVCDLDGTLLSFNGTISENNKNAILELKKKGFLLAAITGRPMYSMVEEVFQLPFDYIVGMNGQTFLDTRTNETFEKEKLKKSDLVKLHKLATQNMCISNLHYEDYTYLIMAKKHLLFGFAFNTLNKMRFVFKQMKKSHVKYAVNIENIDLKDIAKICFISFYGNLKKLQKDIESIPNKPYHTFLVAKNWLEVMPSNINKGEALLDIAKRENIDINHTIAFGDGENDAPMLKAAGIGVAMENGMDKTKKAADYIAPSFLEDGFSKFVYENLLD